MEINTSEIGNRLRALRGDRTREQVAQALGISPSALAMYEMGERVPRDTIKIRIAEYYQKSIIDIFFANDKHET